MRGAERRRWEPVLFGVAAGALLLAAGAALLLQARLHPANVRVAYGWTRLPGAMAAAGLFVLGMWAAWAALTRRGGWKELPSWWFALGIAAVFCVFWVPPLLAGGFDSDDWMLLAAAAARKCVMAHPWLAWQTLDAVDGNFRPLGTVLYIGAMLRWFGAAPLPFLVGLLVFNLAAVLALLPLMRELGYGRVAAAAAALIYLSRSLTYTIETWTCALGDVLVILFCGLSAVALLRALKREGRAAAALHALAFGLFFVATLAKQSAFAFPLIAALVLILRPGNAPARPLRLRLQQGALALAAYGGVAAIAFFHAKALTLGPPAYPLGLSWRAALRTLAYAAWWVGTFEVPARLVWLRWAPEIAGTLVIGAGAWLLRRLPRSAGDRPRDLAFCLLAALASLSLFMVLATRGAAYYGSMAAFWMSMAVAIALSRWSAAGEERGPAMVFCGLLIVGFVDVRLKQTGLLPSGGYTWGTSGADLQGRMDRQIAAELRRAPATRALVLTDMPGYASYFTAMAMVADPSITRMVTHQTKEGTWFVNDLGGAVPVDGTTPLNDAKAYNWTVPVESAEAERVLASGNGPVLRLRFHEGKIERED